MRALLVSSLLLLIVVLAGALGLESNSDDVAARLSRSPEWLTPAAVSSGDPAVTTPEAVTLQRSTTTSVPVSGEGEAIRFRDYPDAIAKILERLALQCDGDDRDTLELLLDGLQEYEETSGVGVDLITYSPALLHALFARAPELRSDAREIFNDSDSPYLKRILLQAMILDAGDLDGRFAELEYDILDTIVATDEPRLLVDCIANVCNRGNKDINRAVLDFALALDPARYDWPQHAGADGVLGCYSALSKIYFKDENLSEDMRRDLSAVASLPEVNFFQFQSAIQLLAQADNADLVADLLQRGTRSLDVDIAAFCRARSQ